MQNSFHEVLINTLGGYAVFKIRENRIYLSWPIKMNYDHMIYECCCCLYVSVVNYENFSHVA